MRVNTSSKKNISFLLAALVLALLYGCGNNPVCSCEDQTQEELEDEVGEEGTFPILKIRNTSNCSSVLSITGVSLVGYQFNSLNIVGGEEQTFNLDEGMSGGYDNINVDIGFRYGNRGWSRNINANFANGVETIIELRIGQGCGASDVNLVTF